MHWKRTLQMIEAHCEGEIGKVVTGGVLNIPGESMSAKLKYLNSVDDSIRKFLVFEPRGALAGSVNLLLPAIHPEADVGFIVLQPDRAHAMSGSNAMCVAHVLLETGMVEMKEPETVITLDTASGLVKVTAQCQEGRCVKTSVDMPPAFVEKLGERIVTKRFGEITFDICYGGVFCALVDVEQLGMKIERSQARGLGEAGVEILTEMNKIVKIRHPEIPEIDNINYVMLRDVDSDGAIRTCTTLWPGRVDRSPCGTGSNANLATLFARGRVSPGDVLKSRSIIDSEFDVLFTKIGKIPDGRPTTQTRITGRCWIYGIHQIGIDPSDPFSQGFVLSDTWGPFIEEK